MPVPTTESPSNVGSPLSAWMINLRANQNVCATSLGATSSPNGSVNCMATNTFSKEAFGGHRPVRVKVGSLTDLRSVRFKAPKVKSESHTEANKSTKMLRNLPKITQVRTGKNVNVRRCSSSLSEIDSVVKKHKFNTIRKCFNFTNSMPLNL